MVAKGEGGRGGKEWEFVISRGKLLYIGWTNNKAYCIAQGTKYIQYSMTNHNEKEYIYIYLSHFDIQKKLTQHCKSTILQ